MYYHSESGQTRKMLPAIPENVHLGHFVIQGLQSDPERINQIDAGTGKKETNASVLARSTRLAKCFNKLGFEPGDVVLLSGKNHLDLRIPFNATAFNGLSVSGVDFAFKYVEIQNAMKILEPKIVFCEPESYDDYVRVSKELGLDSLIVTFDDSDNGLAKFMDKHNDDSAEFQLATFDKSKVSPWLVATSGTTGACKIAFYEYDRVMQGTQIMLMATKTNRTSKFTINLSPVQWISSYFNFINFPLMDCTTVQTSSPLTTKHLTEIINKYKPPFLVTSPAALVSLLKECQDCDMSCFQSIGVTGGKIHKNVLLQARTRIAADAGILIGYGITETMGVALVPIKDGPLGNCGQPFPMGQYKLVDPETEQQITKPNVSGEMWIKGNIFSGYYNNPEETAKAITKDGWFKTGDLLYRDEDNYFFYVDRIKMLIKYRGYSIIPTELEDIIGDIEGVDDVVVTSIPSVEDMEHAVACVVRSKGSQVTAQEIKDVIANKLSASKQLRGGVAFVNKIPLLSTGKVARAHVREMVLSLPRE